MTDYRKHIAKKSIEMIKGDFNLLVEYLNNTDLTLLFHENKSVKKTLIHLMVTSHKYYKTLLERKKNSNPLFLILLKLKHFFLVQFHKYKIKKYNLNKLNSDHEKVFKNMEKLIESIESHEWDLKLTFPKISNELFTLEEFFHDILPNHYLKYSAEIIKTIEHWKKKLIFLDQDYFIYKK